MDRKMKDKCQKQIIKAYTMAAYLLQNHDKPFEQNLFLRFVPMASTSGNVYYTCLEDMCTTGNLLD